MSDLFDIEIWLPFNGGEYHTTVAIGVTQEYIDKYKKEVYEPGLQRWKTAASAFRLPFHHTLNIIPHIWNNNNQSYVKTEKVNEIRKIEYERGVKDGKKSIISSVPNYITNQAKLAEFKKYHDGK